MNLTFPAIAALFAMLCPPAVAGPLGAPKVTRTVGQVQAVGAAGAADGAALGHPIRAEEKLRVGPRSRAEIAFDDGTLARLGADTLLGFHAGTRELALERGTLLLDVPSFRGAARICAGSLKVEAGGGTILVEHLPAQSLKIVPLAGEPRVSTGAFLGDSLVLAAGKMVIVAPGARRISEPVDVDLATLVKTSGLVDSSSFAAGAAPLRGLPRIERAVARQAQLFKAKVLIPTNLAIVGSGTNVIIPAAPMRNGGAQRQAGKEAGAGGEDEGETPKSAEIAQHRVLTGPAEDGVSLRTP